MRAQSEAAVAAADLILFVIDSRDGVTPTDEAFARLVRAAGNPVILVANKCEGRSGRDGFYEAFKLGLGEPVPISAEHGEGLGDLVIAINKWDLVESKDRPAWQKALRSQLTERLSQVPGVPLVMLSALSGRGVDKLMPTVVKAYEVWNKRVSTAALNRWLQEALSRHAPPAARGRGIKLRYMTQPSTRPPTFVAFCSSPQDLPKSYIRYLANSLRDSFDMPGVPIRFNLRKRDNPYDKS